ncbi:MAG: endonuclease domain-containing protein [Polymorphobacter sp.]
MTQRHLPTLATHARDMRNAPTRSEAALWARLRESQLDGLKFRRQTPLGAYIADFFAPSIGLVVEIDGETHEPEADARRDAALAKLGFATVRETNREVATNMEGVLIAITEAARHCPPRFGASSTHPRSASPSRPSREREGSKSLPPLPFKGGVTRTKGAAGVGASAATKSKP